MISINDRVAVHENELVFTASRSSGPGGQNVNKVESRVTLEFDVAGSPSLGDDQKQRLVARLGRRISAAGVLRMHCQVHRSQGANRRELLGRFVELLADALRPRKARKPTRKTAAAEVRRLEGKRRRAAVKRTRGTSALRE